MKRSTFVCFVSKESFQRMTTRLLSRKAQRHERARSAFDVIAKIFEHKKSHRIRGCTIPELLDQKLRENGYRVRCIESQCNHTCSKKCQTVKCLCRSSDYPYHYSTDLCNCHDGLRCSHRCEDLVCSQGTWMLIEKN